MFLNIKMCKRFCHDKEKQISQDAILALENKVEQILLGAIRNTGHFKRVTSTEINFTKS